MSSKVKYKYTLSGKEFNMFEGTDDEDFFKNQYITVGGEIDADLTLKEAMLEIMSIHELTYDKLETGKICITLEF